jgi:hypothetical protein
MAFIPEGARWYLADLVLEHLIEGDPHNVVHVNTHLVEADSPEEAYRKAIDLGKSGEMQYANTDGRQVTVRFRGLRNLNVIHEELEDGAELTYEEEVGVPEAVLASWLTEKKDLGVFAPIPDKDDIPNYMSARVMDMIEARLSAEDGSADTERGP